MPDPLQVIEAAKLILTLAVLTYASVSDHKTREVTNTAWIVYAPIAAALTLAQYTLFEPVTSFWYLPILSIAVTCTFAVILFYAGAFGGADAKALMCIAIAHPQPPTALIQPLYSTPAAFFPITVFSNAVIIAALSITYIIARNIAWKRRTRQNLFQNLETETRLRKTLTLLTGYKVRLDDLKNKPHFYPLEDAQPAAGSQTAAPTETLTEKPRRRLILFPKDEEKDQILKRLQDVAAAESEKTGEFYVWATPGLPMLVFVTVGFVAALLLGDFLWIILRLLFT